MEFQVLGPMCIRRDGHEAGPSGRMQRALLGMLLLRANRAVPADTLVEAMWGDRLNDRVLPNLHVHIHRLRRALAEPRRLTSTPYGYRLTVRAGEVDSERFESLVAEAVDTGSVDPSHTAQLLRTALRLWLGPPFDGVDVPTLVDEARRLEDRRLLAIEQLYVAELARGRHADIISELGEQVRLNPLRERLQTALLVALYRAGQQSRALAVYRTARQVLVEELGQEPGPELRRAHECVLTGVPVDLGERQEIPAPAQLPHDIPDFVGRAPELAELDRSARAAHVPLVVVTGTAGVGKTALARHWAHRMREYFPDGQLYVDMCGYAPDDPVRTGEVLTGFLRALGVEEATIPADTSQRAARFRTMIDGRRMLIILDNALTADQVRALLPGTPSSFVLVTSRDALAGLTARDGAHRVDLDRMSHDEASALVDSRLPADVDRCAEAVARLIGSCAHLPLALRVATSRVRVRYGDGLRELVTELTDERSQLDVLETGDEYTSVRAVFSWSYHQLAEDAARLFRLFAFTCPHREHRIGVFGTAALLGTDDVGLSRRLLDDLVRANLIIADPAGRYAVHELLRVYAAELAEEHEDITAAEERLLGYYLHNASRAASRLGYDDIQPEAFVTSPPVTHHLPDAESARRWLEAEGPALVCCAELAARSGRTGYVARLRAILRRHPGGVGSSMDHLGRQCGLEGGATGA